MHFKLTCVGAAMAGEQFSEFFCDFFRDGGTGAAVDKHGFRSNAFSIDDLMGVKQHLIIVDKPSRQLTHRGVIDQMPPDYSAIKIEGARAYDLARRAGAGQPLPALKLRQVRIDEFRRLDSDQMGARFFVVCACVQPIGW